MPHSAPCAGQQPGPPATNEISLLPMGDMASYLVNTKPSNVSANRQPNFIATNNLANATGIAPTYPAIRR